MSGKAIAGHVDAADDSCNLFLDHLRQATLVKHGVRVEIHLVFKKLPVASQSLEIIRQKTPAARDVFVGLLDLVASLFFRQNGQKRHQNTAKG